MSNLPDTLESIAQRYPFVSNRVPQKTMQLDVLRLLRASPRLTRQYFVDPLPYHDGTEPIMECYLGAGAAFNLPVRNFVYGSNFLSWEEGRKGLKEAHGRMLPSKEVIGYYAMLTTVAPPIGIVSGFVQPNGYTLYSVQSGAHRTAAAIQRGDEYIAVNDMWLYNLPEDILP